MSLDCPHAVRYSPRMKLRGSLSIVALLVGLGAGSRGAQRSDVDFDALPFAPRHYVAYRTPAPLKIDGALDDPAWTKAAWTDTFIDIEGDARPAPRFRTRAKMLWDDERFYVAGDMEEPELWGTLTERDSVIFHDNDFELFIDPDGDTHAYYELEVNTLNTPWDLLLVKPYRDGGPAIHAWDIGGLQTAVGLRGTLNHPGDTDSGWTIEIAMPWKILAEAAPQRKRPSSGDRWRVNFSRVEWTVDVEHGRYVKRLQAGTKNPLPEDNWVWSPQGAINMHMPERWGYVQFSTIEAGRGTDPFVSDPSERVAWALRRLYYRQARVREASGVYATTLDALDAAAIRLDGEPFRPTMQTTRSGYEIEARQPDGQAIHIDQYGRVWSTR
jgi:hypothetical protein